MKKDWTNPEVKDLNLVDTNDDICYCEEGAIAAYGERSGASIWCTPNGGAWKPGYGPGHHHKPPHHGGNCPEKPKPYPPEDDIIS